MSVSIVNQLLGVLTLLGGVVVISLIFVVFFPHNSLSTLIQSYINRYSIHLSLAISAIAMTGSLFYSEIAGYEPCKLCWYQRIFMYPLVFLLAFALYRKDKTIVPYALLMSFLGGMIAFYHYMLQIGVAPELPCSAVGASISCSKQFVLQWGYISIPVMALTAFSMISLFLYVGVQTRNKK